MEKFREKAEYFFKRAKETSDLEAKLILLNNAYNCLCDGFVGQAGFAGSEDFAGSSGLKPAYSLISMSKEEYRALLSACAKDSDVDAKCSPAHYDLVAFCAVLSEAVCKALLG
jgi:hypothetical protein